jgi:hypothetical protein
MIQTERFLIERIAMNRDFWPISAKKSAKIAKLDDFIAIERTIIGLINRDLIGDFDHMGHSPSIVSFYSYFLIDKLSQLTCIKMA